ncbi:MAG: cytochrome c biogenesis protein ResB [Bowdeniella nasicola]|nr:cytochrome c biogenesis protein ResB [Bowdeniella nasicola]
MSNETYDDVPVSEIFRRVYRFFYNKTVGIVLILAMAVVVLLGTVITQAAPGTFDSPEARDSFIEAMRPRYGGWTKPLEVLGLFRVYTSPLFLTITGLLALSIIACTTHRIPQLMNRAFHPRTHVSDAFFAHARYRAELPVAAAPQDALARAEQALGRSRLRVLPDERDPQRARYVDKHRFGPFGTVFAHAAFVLIIVAFGVSSFFGIDEQLPVPVGGAVDVGHDTGLTLRAESFQESFYEDGSPSDYVSHLVLLKDGTEVAEQDVRVNSPLRYEKFAFHQASYGIAADVRVQQDGEDVFTGSVPLRWRSDDGTNAVGRFELEEQKLDVIVVTPASGRPDSSIPAGSAVLEVYPMGVSEPIAVQPVERGGSATIEGLTISFERERQYTGINLRKDPGVWWMWIGSALLILGSYMTFGMRHRRLWLRVEQTEEGSILRFASAEKEDSGFERFFRAAVLAVAQAESSPDNETGAVAPAAPHTNERKA